MKKFSILLLVILWINTTYSTEIGLTQSHLPPVFYPSIVLGFKADSSVADMIISALPFKKGDYFSSMASYEWAEPIQDFLGVSKEKFSICTTFVTPHYFSAWTKFRMKPYQDFMTAPFQFLRGDYSQDLSWIVETPYKVELNDWLTKLSLTIGEELYGLSLEKRIETRARISNRTQEIFLNLPQEKGDRIPHITHRIWITGTQSPCEPSQKRLEAYIESLKKLSGTDWEHNFWCMNPDHIPETVKILKESGLPINIRKLEEIFPSMKAKHLFDAYYQDKQFSFVNDVARLNILYLFGGIYADLGTSFLQDLTPYADAYDYMFTSKIYGCIDNPYFGCKKNNHILKEFLDIIHTLYKLPQKTKDITKRAWEKQGWVGPSLLMVCIDQFSKPEDRFLFVPEGPTSLITIDHAGSWLGREKSGNKTVFESTVDILSVRPLREELREQSAS